MMWELIVVSDELYSFFSRLQVYTDIVRRAAERYGPNSKELDTALHNIDDIMQAKLLDIRSKKQVQNMKVRLMFWFFKKQTPALTATVSDEPDGGLGLRCGRNVRQGGRPHRGLHRPRGRPAYRVRARLPRHHSLCSQTRQGISKKA